MAERKYAKNIITEYRTKPMKPGAGPGVVTVPAGATDLSRMQKVAMGGSPPPAGAAERMARLLFLDNGVLRGAFYMDYVWYYQAGEGGPGPHTHDFDEVLGFLGTDPENPRELGGEMELWLEDEKYLLTQSCLVFAPRGLRHCPMIARRVDRPFIHFTAGTSTEYAKNST